MDYHVITSHRCQRDITTLFVVVALLFYVHGKHLRSCRDGQPYLYAGNRLI